MTPAEYVTEIVLPTVDEYRGAIGDRRRAYLACIAAYHIGDYVGRAEGVPEKRISSYISDAMKRVCKLSFEAVQGICNGSKHCGNTKGKFRFTPGDESDVPVFALDVPGAGFDEGLWDVPGVAVQHAGQKMMIDECLHEVLVGFGKQFPKHFIGVDLERSF